MEDFKPAKPGMVFHAPERKLYIFKKTIIKVYIGWPGMRAWQKRSSKPNWRCVRPRIDVPKTKHVVTNMALLDERDNGPPPPFSTPTGLRAMCCFYKTIPDHICDLVADFPSVRHWHLCSFLARCGDAAFEVLSTCPPLGFMLASNWVFHPSSCPMRTARRLVLKRRREIAGWLGFPATESVVRILSRIPAANCQILPLLYLRDSLQSERRGAPSFLFRHVTTPLSGHMIRIVTDPRIGSRLGINFLNELGAMGSYQQWQSVKMAERALQILSFSIRPTQFAAVKIDSLARLEALSNFASKIENTMIGKTDDSSQFPSPPIPGNKEVQHIFTVGALRNEGREMDNCVGRDDYVGEALRGAICIYTVRAAGARATLALRKTDGNWNLDRLESRSNRPATPACWASVKWWWAVANGDPREVARWGRIRKRYSLPAAPDRGEA